MNITLKIEIGQKYKIPSSHPNAIYTVELLGEHELSGWSTEGRQHNMPLTMLPQAILDGYIIFVGSKE